MANTVHVIVRHENPANTTDPMRIIGVTTLGSSYARKRCAEAAEEEMLDMFREGADNLDALRPDDFLAECGIFYQVIEAPLLGTGF